MSKAGDAPAGTRSEPIFWPPWGEVDGYPALARYVVPQTVQHAGLRGVAGEKPADLDRATLDMAVAEASFGQLRERGIGYRADFLLERRQRVRDARWVLEGGEANCLDLTLLHASMCFDAGAAPLVVIGHGHACLLLRLGGQEDDDWQDAIHEIDGARRAALPIPGAREEAPGVFTLTNLDAFEEQLDLGRFLLVDSMCVAVGRAAGWEEARASARRRLLAYLRIVDAAWLIASGEVRPLPVPTAHPGIGIYVPGGDLEAERYGSREEVMDDLSTSSGLVVLHGEAGTGKSVLARLAVLGSRHASGWFLDASSASSLIDSLAQAELAELGRSGEGLSSQDREAFALAAVARLRNDAKHEWVVVLDNAEADPRELLDWIPRPTGRQLVLATAIDPRRWIEAGAMPLSLDPLTEGDIRAGSLDEAVVQLIEGRPLLLESIKQLQRAEGSDALLLAARRVEARTDLSSALRGPAMLWGAMAELTGPEEQRLCLLAALLPPDHIPAQPLERLAGAGGGVSRMVGLGLLRASGSSGEMGMHRLMGEAIRHHTTAGQLTDMALAVCAEEEMLGVLEQFGDEDTVNRLRVLLDEADAESRGFDGRLGRAFHGLATVCDLKGETLLSSAMFGRALERLDPGLPEYSLLVADALQGRAREVFQREEVSDAALSEAESWAIEAQQRVLEVGRPDRLGRYVAMQGLIKRRTALLIEDPLERGRALGEALDLLEDADARRRDHAPAEQLRSRYNLAGVRVDMAWCDRESAARLLAEAERIYGSVRDGRVELYGRRRHPFVAACHHGLAKVDYARALLLEAEPRERTRWLRGATASISEALEQRQEYEVDRDRQHTRESLALQAKITLLRLDLASGSLAASEASLSQLAVDLEASAAMGAGLVDANIPTER